MQVLGAPLAAALLVMEGVGGMHGWQWLFILEGAATCLWGLVLTVGSVILRDLHTHRPLQNLYEIKIFCLAAIRSCDRSSPAGDIGNVPWQHITCLHS